MSAKIRSYITIRMINLVPHQNVQRVHVFWTWTTFNEVQVIFKFFKHAVEIVISYA
jgi:hypothetical protein